MEQSTLCHGNIEPLLHTPATLASLCTAHTQGAVFTQDNGEALSLPADQTCALFSMCNMAQHQWRGEHLVIR